MKIMLNESRKQSSVKEIKNNKNKISELLEKIERMKEYTEIDFSKSIAEHENRIKELQDNIKINENAIKNGYIIFGEI